MSWVFTLALICIWAALLLMVPFEESGGASAVLAIPAILLGLFLYHLSVVTEVNCYRDGGQVVNTQCMVVKDLEVSK